MIECAKRRKAAPPLPEERRGDLSDFHEAFAYIKARVQQLQRIPRIGIIKAELDEEKALITALEAMKDLSGCFHPDDMIQGETPTRRD